MTKTNKILLGVTLGSVAIVGVSTYMHKKYNANINDIVQSKSPDSSKSYPLSIKLQGIFTNPTTQLMSNIGYFGIIIGGIGLASNYFYFKK